ncbi:hypothetical protein [Parafrigoribacterium soli]|uniref:hypothetical protein n=1 Tax=Parafrigoribacterium soli TaxID=3144663 RepID=UPI0032ED6EF3
MGHHASLSVRTRVLLVDEDNDQRQLLSIHFEPAGCNGVVDIHGPFTSVRHRYETHGHSVSA